MRHTERSWWVGGFFEGRPVPELLATRDIGAVFRLLKTRGWSRAAIAAATGMNETRVRAVAQGRQQVTSYEVLERIAVGLNIERALLGLAFAADPDRPRRPRSSIPAASSNSANDVPVQLPQVDAGVLTIDLNGIRAVLDEADYPADGHVRSLRELTEAVAKVVRLRLASSYTRLSVTLPDLLEELHRAHCGWAGQRRVAVSALLTQAYRAADALADKFGQRDLSAWIIGMMLQTAQESGDEVLLAMASYVRAEVFFRNGRPDVGRALLERAADRLVPGKEPGATAAYGALHMRAAVLAGRAGRVERARDHLAEAATYASLLPEGEYCGTMFGPSSVRIHEVTLAVDTGDADAAARAADGWNPPHDLPGERRSHFYVDVARARAQLGAIHETTTALFQARAVAPEHVRVHPQVRQVVSALLEQAKPTAQLREYANWIGVRRASADGRTHEVGQLAQ